MSSVFSPRVSVRETRGGVTMYLGPVAGETATTPLKPIPQNTNKLPALSADTPHRAGKKDYLYKHGIRQHVLLDGRYRTESSDLDLMADYSTVRRLWTPGADSRRSPSKGLISPVLSFKTRDPQASPASLMVQQNHRFMPGRINTYTSLDFSKLKQYDWNAAKAPRKPHNIATDRLYINTYRTKREDEHNWETPRVSNKTTFLTSEQFEPAFNSITTPSSTQVSNVRNQSDASVANIDTRRLFDRLEELDEMEDILDIKPVNTRRYSADGLLYTTVQHSIDTLQTSRDKTSPHKIRFIDRPLKKEQGRYRPVSKTSIRTPSNSSSNGSQYRDCKSAETYVKYLDSLKEMPVASPSLGAYRARANTKMPNSSRYLESHLSNKLLQSVVDFNRPGQSTHRTHKARETIVHGTQKYGKRRAKASLLEAAAADLIIEPMQIPPPRLPVGLEPPDCPSAWPIRDYYEQPQLDDYRPPSVSSNTCEQNGKKQSLLVDVPHANDMEP